MTSVLRSGSVKNARSARTFFAIVSAVVWVGLVLQVILSATHKGGSFGTASGRVFNFFCFFTVQSNIVVAITTGVLAMSLDRRSTGFRTFRLVGVVAITVTGVVFYVALKNLQELTGWDAVADFILHTASPVLTLVGWLFVGPRGLVSGRIVRLALIPPACWLTFTLIRGTFVQDVNGRDYYPYPFLNVQDHGYLVVVVNSLVVLVLLLGLCAAALASDKHLPGLSNGEVSA